MERNPYAPPDANVADPSREAPAMQRPSTVTWAVRLMWAGMAASTVSLGAEWNAIFAPSGIAGEEGTVAVIFVGAFIAIFFALYALAIWKMGEGRNWARIVLLILQVLSLFENPFADLAEQSLVGAASGILVFFVELAAVVLMFLPASREWFLPRRSP